jgi:hypothetical protein
VAQKFVCRNNSAHDLTQAVLEKLGAATTPVVLAENEAAQPWRVVVRCPYEEEKVEIDNVFSSDVANSQSGDAMIVGMQPTAGDTFWSDAAKEIGPANSLTRAGDSAKFTIQQISLVALVLGGFGIFTDLGGGFDRHPWLFGAVTVAAALALLAAVVALFPQVDESVNPDNLAEVQKSYKSAIEHRATWAKRAAVLLFVAVLLALVAFLEGNDKQADAAITTSWDGSGAQAVLDFTVEFKDLPKGTQPTVRVYGLKTADEKAPKELSKLTLTRSSRGTAKFDEKFVPPKKEKFVAFKIAAKTKDGTTTATLTAPPFTPPPQANAAKGAKKKTKASKKGAKPKQTMGASAG